MNPKHSFLVAQLGARMHYAIPRMLHEIGMLDRFYTDICAVKGWPRFLAMIPYAIQPRGLRRLLGRIPHGVPRKKISALTSLGWAYSQARTGHNEADRAAAIDLAFGQKFCKAILDNGLGQATATYTFNSAGLELMRAAKQAGLNTVMEQTSAPRAVEQEILLDCVQRYPQWGQDVFAGPNIDAFIAREEEEWQHADLILCGSAFVRSGIARRGGPVDKCRVVPYGVDNSFQINCGLRRPGPLRVLTVGQVRLQKGSPVVWEIATIVGDRASFRMVGASVVSAEVLSQRPTNVELVGAVPRSEIVQHYQWADVFLLPSLCEGSATVTYEALMAGLPVICTENTGSIVEDGINGFIVPVFDSANVAERLLSLSRQQGRLATMSRAARSSIQAIEISAYQQRLLKTLEDLPV
jgi:glycosyltransferase involved in cell wall biosynthesis